MQKNIFQTRMDVNTISSVYERNVANLVKEAIAQENSGDIGVYYAKKEALILPVAGVQFPHTASAINRFYRYCTQVCGKSQHENFGKHPKPTDVAFVYSIQLRVNKKIKASPPLGSLSRALDGVPNAFISSIRKNSRNVNGISENQTETESFNPDIRYSRELTTDGRVVVAVVDEDILSNLDLSNWNQETKEAAQKAATRALLKFKGGIAVDGITRKVNRISRKEFTRSEYTNELFWWNSTAFLDKMRAANNLDDIVIAATDWARDGALKHPRTDNLVDFDHGTTLIASGDAKYEAEVVVGITDKGEAVFYDIVNMKPGNFSIKKEEPSPTVTTNKSPDSIFEDSSTSTVAQQEQNVNQKHSRELETVEELKQQNELLKKYSPAQIREIIHLYAEAYGDVNMNAAQVLEEIVCDAMAEMNAFATEQTKRLCRTG